VALKVLRKEGGTKGRRESQMPHTKTGVWAGRGPAFGLEGSLKLQAAGFAGWGMHYLPREKLNRRHSVAQLDCK